MQIIAIVVSSLDGYITKHEEEGVDFASEADQQFFFKALKRFDCCVFGSKTFLTAQRGILNHLLAARLRIVQTRSPENYAEFHHPDMLEFHDLPVEKIVAELKARGKKRCAVLGGAELYTQFSSARLLDELWVTLEPQLWGTGKKLITGQCDIALTLKEYGLLAPNTLLMKYAFPNLCP